MGFKKGREHGVVEELQVWHLLWGYFFTWDATAEETEKVFSDNAPAGGDVQLSYVPRTSWTSHGSFPFWVPKHGTLKHPKHSWKSIQIIRKTSSQWRNEGCITSLQRLRSDGKVYVLLQSMLFLCCGFKMLNSFLCYKNINHLLFTATAFHQSPRMRSCVPREIKRLPAPCPYCTPERRCTRVNIQAAGRFRITGECHVRLSNLRPKTISSYIPKDPNPW